MLGELTPDQIERVLLSEVLGRIGCSLEGLTYVVPVTYAYDGDRVVCHSSVGQKIHMMRQSPHVCFEVEQVDNLANWRCVIAHGLFEELKGDKAALAMSLLVSRLMPLVTSATGPKHESRSVTPHGEQQVGVETIVYCIHLKKKTGRFERT